MFRIRDLVFTHVVACLLALMAHSAPLSATEEPSKPQTLFTNVNIFDGTNDTLAEGMSVLVEGNLIKKVTKGEIAAEGATVIDGGGRTLMPGLIDSHTHLNLSMDGGRPGMEASRWDRIASYGAAGALVQRPSA